MRNFLAFAAITSACLLGTQASAQIVRSPDGGLTGLVVRQNGAIDYANARPMPMPQARTPAPSLVDAIRSGEHGTVGGTPQSLPGAVGSGTLNPVRLFTPQPGVSPQEYGSANQVFTTSRVNASGDKTVNYYPFRAAGKLFFKIGTASYVCSASLVQRGLVVTAAHCVSNYGHQQFYTGWQFVPAYQNGNAPYGTWTAARVWVKTAYYNGTDNCYQTGVICPDDVAIIVLNAQSSKYAGDSTGYFGTGWNGLGFNDSNQALINQLGYPVALDGGNLMERNDSQGYVNGTYSNNTIIGSLMTGGSSGGPWVVNLGMQPTLGCDSEGCAVSGNQSQHNRVVGVTSWGYNPTGSSPKYTVMQQGAAPFTSNNICSLMNSACFNATKGIPAACNIKSLSC